MTGDEIRNGERHTVPVVGCWCATCAPKPERPIMPTSADYAAAGKALDTMKIPKRSAETIALLREINHPLKP